MKIKNNDSFTLDKFIEESLYKKIWLLHEKKSLLAKRVIS